MDNVVVKKTQEDFDDNIKQTNEYSIYDYLKNNPSILIAGVSAIVAAIAFLSKIITNINIRKNLMFWNIDPNTISADNSSLLFWGLMVIFYMLILAIVVICIDSIYKSYLPIKKYKFAKKCLKKCFKDKRQIEKYKADLKSNKKLRKLLKFIHFFKLTGVFILSFIGISLYVFSHSTNAKYLMIVALACSTVLFSLLLVLSKTKANPINKKEIKSDCENGDYKKYITFEGICTIDNDRTIRKRFSNKNLSLFAVQIITFCLLFCVSSIFLPAKDVNKNENMQIVSLNDQEYVVVYQDSEKFFLKEIEVVVDEGNGKQTLVVHTDKQVILTSDSIDMEIRKYDDIKVLDIGEVYK